MRNFHSSSYHFKTAPLTSLFKFQEVVEVAKPEPVKPDPPVVNTPDLNATPVGKEIPKAEPKSSRSGRVIKKTKYLHDEIEDPPATLPGKRKRPSESQGPGTKIQRKVCMKSQSFI